MVRFYRIKTLRKGTDDTGFRWESSPLIESELQIPGNRLNGVSDLEGKWRILALRDPLPDYLLDPASYADGQPEVFELSRQDAKALSMSWVRTGRNINPITLEDEGEWTSVQDVTAGIPE